MKCAIFVAVAVLAAVAAATPMRLSLEAHNEFEAFKAQYNKVYATQEEHDRRRFVFAQNLDFIAKHNADPTQTYKVGVNQFADLTSAEFKEMYLQEMQPQRERKYVTLPEGKADSIDWRTKGAVTPVKNQGQCGSCWSFSTTGSVEGAVAIAESKQAVPLSEQELMDCSTPEGDHGCNGGLMDFAFEFIIKNGGLDTEADYPYTARDGTCDKAKAAKDAAKITGYQDVPKSSDAQMQAALEKGPVSVAIEADQSGFQLYKSGVFSGPCGTQLDHGVLAVGFTADYWIVKNSWGASWGDQGYIMMSRSAGGRDGMCGILLSASYPTGASASASSVELENTGPYGNPTGGCMNNEEAIQITGVPGDLCSPSCSSTSPCPQAPSGVTARPECILEKAGSSQPTNCVLVCTPGGSGCPSGASCQAVSSIGVCTYPQ